MKTANNHGLSDVTAAELVSVEGGVDIPKGMKHFAVGLGFGLGFGLGGLPGAAVGAAIGNAVVDFFKWLF